MDFIEFCEKITNKKLSAWQKEMLLRHAEIRNQQRRTPMDEKREVRQQFIGTDWPRIPELRVGAFNPEMFRPQHMNLPLWHRDEPECIEPDDLQVTTLETPWYWHRPRIIPKSIKGTDFEVKTELLRANVGPFSFSEMIKTKPDVLFAGECTTKEILDLIGEKEEPMESLRDKKIKSVTIECADGKTYVGNVKRIEGNPYCIRECIVEVAVGNPVGKVGIKEVIFANSSTIVKWTDGTETVVSCMDNVKVIEKVVDGKKIKKRKPMKCDTYSKETGLAMAISKKFFGNEGSYNKIFKELCGVEE